MFASIWYCLVINILCELNSTYRSQNQCDCRNRHRFKHVHVLDTFIALVLEPHNVDSFLNDRMLVHPLAFRLVCLEINDNSLYKVKCIAVDKKKEPIPYIWNPFRVWVPLPTCDLPRPHYGHYYYWNQRAPQQKTSSSPLFHRGPVIHEPWSECLLVI